VEDKMRIETLYEQKVIVRL